jgi:hypothetical protein
MSDQFNPQDTHTALNDRVKQAFSLTQDDIDANRAGQMSTLQVERLARPQEDQGGWGVGVLALLLLFGCTVIAGKMNEVKGARGDIGSTVAIMLCTVAVMGLLGLAAAGSLTDDIRNKRIEVIQGSVQCRSYTHKGEMSYRVSIGRKSFLLHHDLYEAFVDGEIYTLYYTPLSEILMAAEHHSGPTPTPGNIPPQRMNPLTPPSAHA